MDKAQLKKQRERETAKRYYQKHREEILAKKKKYGAENKDKIKVRNHEYRIKNKPKFNAKFKKRQAAKLQRTPAWLTKDDHFVIEQIYELAALRAKMLGIEHHVDHIYPLQGERVSGLHVPQNLQVIPARENLVKRNKFNP